MKHRHVRLLSLLLLSALLLSLFLLPSCSNRAPHVEEIRARVTELVEASYEINTVFYGEGLAVYDRDEELYRDLYAFYAAPQYVNTYNIVSDHARFTSIAQIKQAAERVYSLDLLESSVYVTAFTGYVVSGIGTSTASAPALYLEDGEFLYQSISHRNYLKNGIKIFDYSTMRVTRQSTRDAVYVEMQCHYISSPDAVFTDRLRLTKSASGTWLLDSLTV